MLNTLTLAKQLIDIESITPNDNQCQTIIIDLLKSLGFNITRLPSNGVSNFWAHWGNHGPLFAFSGHTDTVPAGPTRQWRFAPFTATEHEGELFGRGAADMKAAISAMVCAIDEFLNETKEIHFQIGMMLTSDEEGPALDGTTKIVDHLIENHIPLKWCLVGEATSLKKLGDSIKIGRRGSLHGALQLIGKQGHIAYPHLADNPIHHCFKALDALTHEHWDQGNEHFAPTSFQIYQIHADTGASNVIPGRLSAKFNFRFSPCSKAEELQQRVIHTLNTHNLEYEIDWNLSSQPFLSQPGSLLSSCQQAIQSLCQITPFANTAGGTSDGRFIARTGCEIVELGPINASIHQVNERINIDDLHQLKNIYKQVLINLNLQVKTQGSKDAILVNEVRT